MLPQILIAFGAAVFGLLGTIHIVYTFFTKKFEARDAATSAAMKATSPVLTQRTSSSRLPRPAPALYRDWPRSPELLCLRFSYTLLRLAKLNC